MLREYAGVSVLFLAGAAYHAAQYAPPLSSSSEEEPPYSNGTSPAWRGPRNEDVDYFVIDMWISRVTAVCRFMMQEPLCIWALINMAYCSLALLGRWVQHCVFGELRLAEQQKVKEKVWNFLIYKFIFIFGIMNVQFLDEMVLWCSWFSLLGFLHVLLQLCNDRWDYLWLEASKSWWPHLRMVSLLAGILVLSLAQLGLSFYLADGLHTLAFMAAECAVVTARSAHLLLRNGAQLWGGPVLEKKVSLYHTAEVILELAALSVDFLNHLHMLLCADIFLSMAGLVIGMQLRQLYYEIRHRWRKYRNYRAILANIDTNYPLATAEELARRTHDSDCPICWEHMETARKLPCGHVFHNVCLRSWLEQDASCPTCRLSLTEPHSTSDSGQGPARLESGAQWLPAVLRVTPATRPLSAQLDYMVGEILVLFPSAPVSAVREDLVRTGSLEVTVDNILEGRLWNPADSSSIFISPSEKKAETPPKGPRTFHEMPQASRAPRRLRPPSNLVASFTAQETLLERKLRLLEMAKMRYLSRQQLATSSPS